MEKLILNINKQIGKKNIYGIYLKNVHGVHYDNHNGIQIIYIISGKLTVRIDGKEKKYREGDIFLFNNKEMKFLYSKDVKNLSLILNIHNEYLSTLENAYVENYFVNEFENQEHILELKKAILNIYKFSINYDEVRVMENINIILDGILYSYINKGKYIPNLLEKMDCLYDLKSKISMKNINDLSLESMSEELHLSSSYISKIFSDLTSIKYSEYIQQYKLYMAAVSLLYTNKNIEDIAFDVGFGSAKSLNRIFERYLYLTPSEYRNKYREYRFDLESKKNYNFVLEVMETLEFSKFEDIYRNNNLDQHSFSLDDIEDKKLPKWKVIRNINILGENYIENLKIVASKFKVDEILLRFKMDDMGNIILIDNNRVLEKKQLYEIFDICLEYNITPVIGVKLVIEDENYTRKKDILDRINENMVKYEQFYNAISDVVGITNMKRFSYSINIDNLYKYIDDKELLDIYRLYIIKQQRLLKEKLGTRDYKWGYDLGKVEAEDIEKLKSIYYMFYDYKFKPSHLIISYNFPDLFKLNSLEEADNLRKNIKDFFYDLEEENKDIANLFNRIYILDIFEKVDLSNIRGEYKDLLAVLLIIETLFFIEFKQNFFLGFKMADDWDPDGNYYPVLIDDYGFRTVIYWIYFLIDQMKGNLIYKNRNVLVTRDDKDIYILIFGDILIDTIFGLKNNFKNLDNHDSKIELEIKDMKGKYKITTETLSYEDTSIGHLIEKRENIKYLNNMEKEYLRLSTIPKFEFEIKEIKPSYKETVNYSPFNIILKRYRKI